MVKEDGKPNVERESVEPISPLKKLKNERNMVKGGGFEDEAKDNKVRVYFTSECDHWLYDGPQITNDIQTHYSRMTTRWKDIAGREMPELECAVDYFPRQFVEDFYDKKGVKDSSCSIEFQDYLEEKGRRKKQYLREKNGFLGAKWDIILEGRCGDSWFAQRHKERQDLSGDPRVIVAAQGCEGDRVKLGLGVYAGPQFVNRLQEVMFEKLFQKERRDML